MYLLRFDYQIVIFLAYYYVVIFLEIEAKKRLEI